MDDSFKFEEGYSDDELANKEHDKVHSPWEFSSYTASVAEDHARRRTSSVDDKIYKARMQQNIPIPDDDIEDSAKEELNKELQDSFKPVEKSSKNVIANGRKITYFTASNGVSFHAKSFMALNLSRPLLKACEALGYHKPTPIQAACIPIALTGQDVCGSAITGSGKTAAFMFPILERLLFRPKRIHAIRVLVLTPTRELAIQVHSMTEKLAQFTDIRCALVVGGLSLKVQEAALRAMPDIVVATPGRIIDHLRNSQSVGLEDLAILVLDEADRLLELGFSAEIRELIRHCPKHRQTMLFSATMTEDVDELVKLSLTKPSRLSADPFTKRPESLTEEVVRIRPSREAHQEAVLLALCLKTFSKRVIIFSGTKKSAHRLKILFGLVGLKASELHGNLIQIQRLEALELFRKQQVDFLIATDVAARGLDIVGVHTVINFACPRNITSYIHRVGRTARAGRDGYAVTFVTDNDRSLLKGIAKKAGSTLKNRLVAENAIAKWSQTIELLEDKITAILHEEMEERELRKAEMVVMKAENMIEHKDAIFSRPERTWFATNREKKLLAKASKDLVDKDRGKVDEVISAEKAEEIELKDRKRKEYEKNLPRKKRRKLQAAREIAEARANGDLSANDGKRLSLIQIGHQRAKSVKAIEKANGDGLFVKRRKILKPARRTSQSSEMMELFRTAMREGKERRTTVKNRHGVIGRKGKCTVKRKARYKHRR